MTVYTDRTGAIGFDDMQVLFEIGDQVRFSPNARATLRGTVTKLNPTRARVRCGTDDWNVPYPALDHVCSSTARDREQRGTRLAEVAAIARELMDRHGLSMWTLRFNGSRNRLGTCDSRRKTILLGRIHAVEGTRKQITDTILHEIAHALAGPAAGHGPAWKAIARQLGATPKSCAPESDTTRRTRETAKSMFAVGDTVSFVTRGDRIVGTIERMNPKRARVRSADTTWSVPYARLVAFPERGPEAVGGQR